MLSLPAVLLLAALNNPFTYQENSNIPNFGSPSVFQRRIISQKPVQKPQPPKESFESRVLRVRLNACANIFKVCMRNANAAHARCLRRIVGYPYKMEDPGLVEVCDSGLWIDELDCKKAHGQCIKKAIEDTFPKPK